MRQFLNAGQFFVQNGGNTTNAKVKEVKKAKGIQKKRKKYRIKRKKVQKSERSTKKAKEVQKKAKKAQEEKVLGAPILIPVSFVRCEYFLQLTYNKMHALLFPFPSSACRLLYVSLVTLYIYD